MKRLWNPVLWVTVGLAALGWGIPVWHCRAG